MSELKPRITENGIDYILVGDYYIPDLKLPEEHRPIGKYGRMHREYLREVHPARLSTLTLSGLTRGRKVLGATASRTTVGRRFDVAPPVGRSLATTVAL
jgi:hypothetical protein